MEALTGKIRIEPRWPAALAIIAVLFILEVLSSRVHLLPSWYPYVLGLAQLLPMAGVRLSRADARWRRIERATTMAFAVVVEVGVIASLSYLIFKMLVGADEVSGRQLLTSSVGTWIANILSFSMAYWQIDRGGPELRANTNDRKPDWLFAQAGAPGEARAEWHPTFVDYLFLSFSTATAFSTTDTVPVSARAKLLMMLESAVSLVTLVIVAARSINILGG